MFNAWLPAFGCYIIVYNLVILLCLLIDPSANSKIGGSFSCKPLPFIVQCLCMNIPVYLLQVYVIFVKSGRNDFTTDNVLSSTPQIMLTTIDIANNYRQSTVEKLHLKPSSINKAFSWACLWCFDTYHWRLFSNLFTVEVSKVPIT